MSFIDSTDRTLGIASKLCAEGGEVVNHSNVLPFNGAGLATRPYIASEIAVAATRISGPPAVHTAG